MIKKKGDKFILYNKDGTKELGSYDSKNLAMEEEKKINSKKMEVTEKKFQLVDLKPSFISLVDKGANERIFSIMKSKNDIVLDNIQIIKSEIEKGIITSIVYEPNVLDAHNDFMTIEEIEKSAHWFLANKGNIDLQHNFDKISDVELVESWVSKTDFVLGDDLIKKGTWLASVKVNNKEILEKIKNDEITGFSLGGIGKRVLKEGSQMPNVLNMEEIKKAIAEVLESNKDNKLILKVKQNLEDFEKSFNTKNTENENEISNLKELITNFEKQLGKVNLPNGKDEEITKAYDTYREILKVANTTTGASTIPLPLSNAMSMDMKEISPFYGDGTHLSATGTSIRVPIRKPNVTTSAEGKLEGQGTTDGTINIVEIEITKGVIQSTIPLTDELRRDSQFGAVDYVRGYATEDIAEQIAERTFKGVESTKNKIIGFSLDSGFLDRCVNRENATSISYNELMLLKKNVKPQYRRLAKWYVSNTMYYLMKTMKDEQGRPLWIESLIPNAPSTFDGNIVVECYQMDDSMPILFADFGKFYYYFVDYQMESESDRKGTEGYTNEIMRSRMGGKVANIMSACGLLPVASN